MAKVGMSGEMDGNAASATRPLETREMVAGDVSSRPRRPQRLSPGASLVLDVVRFLAAVVVALGHLTLPVYSTGLPDLMPWATAAVGVFFVLSGFIIRYVTLYRESSLADYAADRVSRLYSVVLPALAFTVLVDVAARLFDRRVSVIPAGEYLLRLVTTATFTSQTWFQELSPIRNGAFWSLSYEAIYYALYGAAFYLRGVKRVVVLFALALIAGPSVLLLAPIWFLGCSIQEWYEAIRHSRRQSLLVVGFLFVGAVAAFGAVAVMPHAWRMVPKVLAFRINHQAEAWHLQKFSTWYLESGLPAGVALLGLLLLFDRVRIPTNSPAVRVMRYIADGTFPLYLFHGPMLFLIRVFVPYDRASRWQVGTILTVVVVVCILLGGVCNRLKDLLRGLLHRRT